MSQIFGIASPLMAGFADVNMQASVRNTSLAIFAGGSAALIILISFTLVAQKTFAQIKPAMFALVFIISVGTIVLMDISVLQLNAENSHGPIDWQAPVAFWACGNELALRDPVWPNAYIGSPNFYVENSVLHISGTLDSQSSANLSEIITAIGGKLTNTALTIPLSDSSYFITQTGMVDGTGSGAPLPGLLKSNLIPTMEGTSAQFKDGEHCGTEPATVQVFIDTMNQTTKTFTQIRLTNPQSYALAAQTQTSPECVIVEFAPIQTTTNRLCHEFNGFTRVGSL